MSLGSWDPKSEAATAEVSPDAVTLERFINLSKNEQLDTLEAHIDGSESQRLSALMRLDHAHWQAAAEPLESGALLHLIRFFAVAENLPGWEAAERSPVIALAKVLRNRGERLDKAFLLWLREVNTNRFLPYGPL